MNNFRRHEYKVKTLARFNKVVENKNPGNVAMYPINKREISTTQVPVNRELFYVGSTGTMYKYHHSLYYTTESSTCKRYPNQITKLMDLLVAFEKKNCVPSNMSASLYDRLADKFDNITINKWPC